MLFSIVIPTYNRATILKETLHSALAQTCRDFEIIVVDDGSTDNTKQIIEEIGHDKIIYHYKKNEERSIARNFGADKASGQYLIFLDSDDKMDENHLLMIYKFLEKNKFSPLFIFTGYKLLRPDGQPVYAYAQSGVFKPERLAYGNYLGCSSVVVSKELFKKYYFNTDPKIILFEDWELWLRILSENTLNCLPNKTISMTNHHGRSVLNSSAEQLKNKITALKNQVLNNSPLIANSFINKRTFLMGLYSYASLHIALTKRNKASSIKLLLLSFFNCPTLIFKKRFFGIIKQLLF